MHLTCRWFWGRWKEGGKDTPSPEPPQWHLSLQYTFHQFWWVALSPPNLSLETLHMIHATKTVGVRVHCWCNFWSTLPLEIYNLFNSVARLFKQWGSTSVYSNKMHKTNWKGLAWKKNKPVRLLVKIHILHIIHNVFQLTCHQHSLWKWACTWILAHVPYKNRGMQQLQ